MDDLKEELETVVKLYRKSAGILIGVGFVLGVIVAALVG